MVYNNIKMNKVQVLRSQASQQRSQHSDKSNLQDDDDQTQQINAPRIDRNLSYEPDFTHVILSTAFTHYPVIREVALNLGMKVTDEPEQKNWDVCWTDLLVTPHTFIRMHFHQSINYIPGIYTIARKNLLGRSLNSMRKHFPLDYNFHPPTWMLPQDYHQLRKHFQLTSSKNQAFIVKPEAECQGRGIYLVNRLEEIQIGKYCVVQRYVPNPLLIDGYKFDLRIYVLIGSIDPLRIYIFNDGLGRFATEAYQTPHQSNFRSNYQHLTNYAINKLNPKFKAAMSGGQGEGGFKRSLQSVMKSLKEMGADTDLLWSRIKQISVKTIITSYEYIKHSYLFSQPQEYHNRMAFHILGLDILINDHLQPILLEVNHTPSFATETPLDHRIKFNLIKDTLKLMRCDSTQLKKQLFNKSKIYSNKRIENGKRQSFNEQIRKRQTQSNTQARVQFEKDHLGGYEVIYPAQQEQINIKYNMLIDKAKKILYSSIKKKKLKIKAKEEIEIKKQPKQFKDITKLSHKQLIEKSQQPQSQRKFRNHSMYNEKFNRAEPQLIQQTIKNLSQNQIHLHPQNNMLFNLQFRTNRTFTIKTKHSLADNIKKDTNKQQLTIKKQKIISNKQVFREGNFVKPKTYDAPSLKNIQYPRTIIYPIKRKKSIRPIHHL